MEFGKSIVLTLLGLAWLLGIALMLCSIIIFFNTLGSGFIPEVLTAIIVLITMGIHWGLSKEFTDALGERSNRNE
jgi:hypothetical protein|tara:strand:+ start:106 stop:330 length:225 start_codon:yes stop_codon:yes gene_type:complete